ncbi:hypothetical protein FEI14_08815 [Lacticaseibacillus zeae]|uniref:Uncharacterized protein n=1 Tax=Lacticaseibacillus zeae TaxID=57037 RepID=A0A5R8M0B1_LACZE|nr:hypothetical protein FEI14_08815 [Lacticaseibacillus zeae]
MCCCNGSITRSPAQKPACKDPWSQWPKPGPSRPRPLTLRLLTALAHAHLKRGNIPCQNFLPSENQLRFLLHRIRIKHSRML